MKLNNAAITLLVNDGVVTIGLTDVDAGYITFAEVKLTPEQFTKALSRSAHIPCSIEVFGLDTLNKIMEHKTIEFKMPEKYEYSDREKIAIRLAEENCPVGWISDNYFNSQNSFFIKDGSYYARCIIRRWVDNDNNKRT